MFKVGQKVVCVDESGPTSVVKGEIYTVTSISPSEDDVGEMGVSLKEKTPITHPKYFRASRFRPLISQADDVAMFQKLVESMKPTERLDVLRELLDTTSGG